MKHLVWVWILLSSMFARSWTVWVGHDRASELTVQEVLAWKAELYRKIAANIRDFNVTVATRLWHEVDGNGLIDSIQTLLDPEMIVHVLITTSELMHRAGEMKSLAKFVVGTSFASLCYLGTQELQRVNQGSWRWRSRNEIDAWLRNDELILDYTPLAHLNILCPIIPLTLKMWVFHDRFLRYRLQYISVMTDTHSRNTEDPFFPFRATDSLDKRLSMISSLVPDELIEGVLSLVESNGSFRAWLTDTFRLLFGKSVISNQYELFILNRSMLPVHYSLNKYIKGWPETLWKLRSIGRLFAISCITSLPIGVPMDPRIFHTILKSRYELESPEYEMLAYGFKELIPESLLSDGLFESEELALVLRGQHGGVLRPPEFRNQITVVCGKNSKAENIINWLWELVEEEPHIGTMLVQIIAGLRNLPVGGLSLLPFRIVVRITQIDSDVIVPVVHSHSCQLELPVYSSKAVLETMIVDLITANM